MLKIKMKEELKQRTKNKIYEFVSPARINLIGEHIDYVGGIVVPATISLKIEAFASKSDNIEIKSLNFSDDWYVSHISFNKKYNAKYSFMNFVYGCFSELKKLFPQKINSNTGFKLILSSAIPVASGLSSSAAFGMLILEVLNEFYKLDLNPIDKVKIFQKVENNFIGLQSGIMDQFAITFGKKKQFISLNTNTLEYEYINAQQDDYDFLLLATNKSRQLVDSGYNQRVKELTKVSKILNKPFMELSTCTKIDLEKINDNILYKRLRHVITEVQRVKIISEKLLNIKGKELGKLINESHESLSNDYEVSCNELDFIQEEINKIPGVFGARMIGAGFGGCVLAIVEKGFDIDKITFYNKYKELFNVDMDVYKFNIIDGVKKVNNG